MCREDREGRGMGWKVVTVIIIVRVIISIKRISMNRVIKRAVCTYNNSLNPSNNPYITKGETDLTNNPNLTTTTNNLRNLTNPTVHNNNMKSNVNFIKVHHQIIIIKATITITIMMMNMVQNNNINSLCKILH